MQDRNAATPGFTVKLEGASLFDLIQFECMDVERKILRVSAQGRTGVLYFRDGNLVHAAAGDAVGESAVRAMLSWKNGQVAHSAGAWPAYETITTSWQSVLLHAATAADEVSRVDNVVSFPARDAAFPSAGDSMVRDVSIATEAIHAARITASGDVVAVGAKDRDVAEVFAFVAELADVVGDSLAIDRMCSVEIWSSEASGLVLRDPKTAELRAAWAARSVDPAKLREALACGDA